MVTKKPVRVAVLGGGPQGLTMLKNLLELNTPQNTIFDVELLEGRDGFGGIWNFSKDPDTITTLPSTLSNVTRFRNCYADFPVREAWEMAQARGDKRASEEGMSELNGAILKEGRKDPGSVEGIPIFLSSSQQQMYYEMYAEKFKLTPHMRLGRLIQKVSKNEKTGQWNVEFKDKQKGGEIRTEAYDKVVLSTGQQDAPNFPKVEGIEKFKGDARHVMGFKDPTDYKGKKVMVVGFGSTAADTATALVGHADKIYLSHRSGASVVPRVVNHMPLDVGVKRRNIQRANLLGTIWPLEPIKQFHKLIMMICQMAYGNRLKPEWGFAGPTTTVASSFKLIISENLVECLEQGSIEIADIIHKALDDGKTVELRNGTKVELDAIIFATGYHCNSIDLPIEYTGTPPLARLYQNVFLPSDPYNFAAQSFWHLPTGICEPADLMAMAIAQVFAGNYKLPSRASMERHIDQWHANNRSLIPMGFLGAHKLKNSRVIMINEAGWRHFLHDAAGTQFNEKLGWGVRGLLFWASDPQLSYKLMMGVDNPSVYRLWPGRGGRKAWPRARQAIEDANREADAYMTASKAKAEAE